MDTMDSKHGDAGDLLRRGDRGERESRRDGQRLNSRTIHEIRNHRAKPQYGQMSLRKLREELKQHEYLLRDYGPKLSDGGLRLEWTVGRIKREIRRAEKEVEDLARSLAGLQGPSANGITPNKRGKEQQSVNVSGAPSSTGDVSVVVKAEYEAELKNYERQRQEHGRHPTQLFKPRPPVRRMSLQEVSEALKNEEALREKMHRIGIYNDVKYRGTGIGDSPIRPGDLPEEDGGIYGEGLVIRERPDPQRESGSIGVGDSKHRSPQHHESMNIDEEHK